MVLEEVKFHTNICGFLQTLYDDIISFRNDGYVIYDPDKFMLFKTYVTLYDKKQLIEMFILNGYGELWDKIGERDERFFIENIHKIFNKLPSTEVSIFRNIFTMEDKNGDKLFTKEDKDEIWNLFDSLIKISINYIHQKRDPCIEFHNGKPIPTYRNPKYMEFVDLRKNAKKWKIELKFKKTE